jgi:ubiquinone/menaquinone biosynthesis C-methylase UbiE
MSLLAQTRRLFRIDSSNWDNQLAQAYELLSTQHGLGESSLYLNFGYWDGATRYDDACQRLAEILGEAAGLGPGCTQLDCGSGFGDAAFYWVERFKPDTIDCLNTSRSQVVKASERARAANLEQRVRLHLGSATQIPFAAASFDRVTALESAHHYNTREDFFREAFRVLKPGGRLATADFLAVEARPKRWLQRLGNKVFGASTANMYPRSGYAQRLENAGFTGVRVESIADKVFAPSVAFARNRLRTREVRARMNPFIRWGWALSLASWAHDEFDYVIAIADKL